MTYRKVGGLHHWRVGRLGGSFYIAKRRAPTTWDSANDRFITVGLMLLGLVTVLAYVA